MVELFDNAAPQSQFTPWNVRGSRRLNNAMRYDGCSRDLVRLRATLRSGSPPDPQPDRPRYLSRRRLGEGRSEAAPHGWRPRFRKRDLAVLFLMLPSKRLFVGLELPASCKTTLLSLDPQLTGLRWVVDEQLHLTLSFLGNVDTFSEDRLREALDQVRVLPFFLPLCSVGVFNVRGQPSVVWAGVGKGHPHLFLLHRRIRMQPCTPGSNPILNPFTRMLPLRGRKAFPAKSFSHLSANTPKQIWVS
jgi:LigT like Phosphoesterase